MRYTVIQVKGDRFVIVDCEQVKFLSIEGKTVLFRQEEVRELAKKILDYCPERPTEMRATCALQSEAYAPILDKTNLLLSDRLLDVLSDIFYDRPEVAQRIWHRMRSVAAIETLQDLIVECEQPSADRKSSYPIVTILSQALGGDSNWKMWRVRDYFAPILASFLESNEERLVDEYSAESPFLPIRNKQITVNLYFVGKNCSEEKLDKASTFGALRRYGIKDFDGKKWCLGFYEGESRQFSYTFMLLSAATKRHLDPEFGKADKKSGKLLNNFTPLFR